MLETGESKMALKKLLEGMQERKAKRKQAKVDKLAKQRDKAKAEGKYKKQARKQNKINKKLGKKADTPSGKHKGKDLKAKAEKDASWKKATESAKKSGGPDINTLVKARGMHEKGSDDWKKIQNKINEHYGSSKRYEGGGKVESSSNDAGMFNWPSTDARKR